MMANIETLIKQISKIVVEERIQQEEKRKRGENFNIFSVLGLSTSEVRLHSAFLAELLNPNGNHGLGNQFLEAFLQTLVNNKRIDPRFEIDTKSCKVSVEHPIGEIPEDYSEGGRIDLLIEDNKKHAIVIENKINAGDQYKQLLRYHNYAIKNSHEHVLLYLTKFRTKAEEYSAEDVDYQCIGYNDDILPWLQNCLGIAAVHPIIRETIRQYITNLKDILSIMEQSNLSNMLDILTSRENVSTTIDIITQSWAIQNRIREIFINDISDLCKDLGFSFMCDDGVKTASNNSWIHIRDDNYKDIEMKIGVERHTNYDGFCMCFVPLNGKAVNGDYRFWANGSEPNINYPFGWMYLWSESGEPNSGIWWRWDNWSTLRDMANGSMLAYIKRQLLRIKEEDAFKKMNDLLE
ncbi:MAG: PD-(D/E)XK nuclease family protein [Muribaculaceae bacterium]|nr:PD-(D/E)XK nuclease family protein [Muribaculaceae bacterium]